MGRIPSSWTCQKEPRSSSSFKRVKASIAVNAAVPTETFLPLFAAVNFRLNMDNYRMGQAQSSRPTSVCGRRSNVLAGVTKYNAAILCLTPWTPAGASANTTKNLLSPSSEQQNLLHCKRSQYDPPNRRYSYTRPHRVTHKNTVSRLAVATFSYCPLSRSV